MQELTTKPAIDACPFYAALVLACQPDRPRTLVIVTPLASTSCEIPSVPGIPTFTNIPLEWQADHNCSLRLLGLQRGKSCDHRA